MDAVAQVRVDAVDVCHEEERGDNGDNEQQRETVAYNSRKSVERVFDENGNFMKFLDDFCKVFRGFLEIQCERFLGGSGVSADGFASLGETAPGTFFRKPKNLCFLSLFDIFDKRCRRIHGLFGHVHNQEAGHRNEIPDVLDLLGRNDADDMRGNLFEALDVVVERTEFCIRCGQGFRAAKRDIYVCG